MDVETHSKPKVIKNIMVEATAGASTDKEYSGQRELRASQYLVCGINMPSSNYRLAAYNNNNSFVVSPLDYANQSSATPGRSTEVTADYSIRRGDSLSVNISAGYASGRSETENSTYTSYFPTEIYSVRQIDNINYTTQNKDNYRLSSSVMIGRKRSTLQVRIGADYGTSKNEQIRTIDDITDQTTLNQRQQTTNRGDNKSCNMSLMYNTGVGKGGYISANARANIGKNTDHGWRVDTLGTTSFRTLLNNDGNAKNTTANADITYAQSLSKKSSLSLTYKFDYTYQLSRQLSLDYLNNSAGVMDSINTYDYTIDQTRNQILLSYSYRGEKSRLSIGANAGVTTIARDERLPADYRFPYTFYSLSPELSYSYDFTPQRRIYFRVDSEIESISVEQLRDVIINNNPMFLTVGNPNLNQPMTTNAYLTFHNTIASKNINFSLSLNGSYTHDDIATKTLYFAEQTELSQYDYTAPKGASLTTYENAGRYFKISPNINFDKRLSSISSTLKIVLAYDYASIPFFLQQESRTTAQHQLNLGANLTAGFSQYIKPEINSITRAGVFTSGPYGKSRYVEEQLSGVLRSNFAKRYMANTMVTYNLYRNDKSAASSRNDIYWNFEVGRRFGKKNQLRVMVGVIDILNRSANRSVTILNDYITTSSTSILGRYCFVDLGYTF